MPLPPAALGGWAAAIAASNQWQCLASRMGCVEQMLQWQPGESFCHIVAGIRLTVLLSCVVLFIDWKILGVTAN